MILLELERTPQRVMRLCAVVYRGAPYLEARIWTKQADGTWKRDLRRGVLLRVSELGPIADLFASVAPHFDELEAEELVPTSSADQRTQRHEDRRARRVAELEHRILRALCVEPSPSIAALRRATKARCHAGFFSVVLRALIGRGVVAHVDGRYRVLTSQPTQAEA